LAAHDALPFLMWEQAFHLRFYPKLLRQKEIRHRILGAGLRNSVQIPGSSRRHNSSGPID
jgi:hypothetical protein